MGGERRDRAGGAGGEEEEVELELRGLDEGGIR
jgi:hypothetical protein